MTVTDWEGLPPEVHEVLEGLLKLAEVEEREYGLGGTEAEAEAWRATLAAGRAALSARARGLEVEHGLDPVARGLILQQQASAMLETGVAVAMIVAVDGGGVVIMRAAAINNPTALRIADSMAASSASWANSMGGAASDVDKRLVPHPKATWS